MKILLVDDEQELAEPLSQILTCEGYEVHWANTGEKGVKLALNGEYDLFILDWILPHKSGLEICQEIRSQGKQTPVLFLTAKDTIDDRVLGLDAGADDYLIKPFELRELLARVRALLRRTLSNDLLSISRLKYQDLELEIDNQTAYRQGKTIPLSEKETQLLAYLMQSQGQIVTHDQIYHYLWQNQEQPNSNVIPALIRLLRKKIDFPQISPLIHTVYGKGYRLCPMDEV